MLRPTRVRSSILYTISTNMLDCDACTGCYCWTPNEWMYMWQWAAWEMRKEEVARDKIVLLRKGMPTRILWSASSVQLVHFLQSAAELSSNRQDFRLSVVFPVFSTVHTSHGILVFRSVVVAVLVWTVLKTGNTTDNLTVKRLFGCRLQRMRWLHRRCR